MTAKAEWLALAERCEKATGPDREIDQLIFNAACGGLYWPENDQFFYREAHGEAHPIMFTKSIDAITALIERELPGSDFDYYGIPVGKPEEQRRAVIFGAVNGRGVADISTLALCAAFCRAMAEKAGEP